MSWPCAEFHSALKPNSCVFYKGHQLKKRYVPDLLVFGSVVVELKAVTQLLPEHEAQLLNYMRIAQQTVGYLVNFGHKDTLEWKRFILKKPAPEKTFTL